MLMTRHTFGRLLCAGASFLFVLAASVGCRVDYQFPTGSVRVNSNGVSVQVDGGGGSGDSVIVDGPFIHVDVED